MNSCEWMRKGTNPICLENCTKGAWTKFLAKFGDLPKFNLKQKLKKSTPRPQKLR